MVPPKISVKKEFLLSLEFMNLGKMLSFEWKRNL